MEVTNSELRKKSFALYKTHWKALMLVSFITALPALIILPINLLNGSTIVSQIITFIIYIVLYPFNVVGMTYVYLETWRGGTPKALRLLYFCSSRKLWVNTLILGLVYHIILRIFSIPDYISVFIPDNSYGKYILQFLSFVFAIAFIWATLRLTLLPYLYNVEHTLKSVGEIFREAISRMKGHVGSFIWLMITVSWWMILIAVLPLFFSVQAPPNTLLYIKENSNKLILLAAVCYMLVFLPLIPYVSLVVTGFANRYIPSESDIKSIMEKTNPLNR